MKNYTSKFKNDSGFSLIELLVVIGIIAILSGIIAINYKSGQKQLTLNRAASKLAQDIRRAQEMAMSSKELPGGGVPSGGYGIYFDMNSPNSYKIYADQGATQNECYDAVEVIETISLEAGVRIDYVADWQTSVNFKPPDPKVALKDHACNDITSESQAQILLMSDSNYWVIKVNWGGRIEITKEL